MTTTSNVSWNKITVFCSVFGIPLISVLIWVVVIGTQALGQLTMQGSDIKDMKADLRGLHTQVDSIASRQREAKLEKDITERINAENKK